MPCFERLDDLYAYAAACGVAAEDLQEDAALSHRLTHRLLQITPLRAQTAAVGLPAGAQWAAAADYGLPKPLAAYLQQLL